MIVNDTLTRRTATETKEEERKKRKAKQVPGQKRVHRVWTQQERLKVP
jgi:hypothetical protein